MGLGGLARTLSPVRLYRSIRHAFKKNTHSFLARISGVIHVGAHFGEERERYAKYGVYVVWAEPNPAVFSTLERNIAAYPRQRAYRELITDRDDATYEFKVSNNEGASSSIYDMGPLSAKVWPGLGYTHSVSIRSVTLPTLVRREALDMRVYDSLVLDTQGSELAVLKGAEELLRYFRYIRVEVADFECYTGGCLAGEVEEHLTGRGYREICRDTFASVAGTGSAYDVVYERMRRPD